MQLHTLIYYTREKSYPKTSFQLRMKLKKEQKQGKNERTQKDCPTSAKTYSRCRVDFLRSFIFALHVSVLFSAPSLTEMNFLENFFPSFRFLGGFFKPPSKEKTNSFIVLQTNTFD